MRELCLFQSTLQKADSEVERGSRSSLIRNQLFLFAIAKSIFNKTKLQTMFQVGVFKYDLRVFWPAYGEAAISFSYIMNYVLRYFEFVYFIDLRIMAIDYVNTDFDQRLNELFSKFIRNFSCLEYFSFFLLKLVLYLTKHVE